MSGLPGELPTAYKPRRSLRTVAFCAVAFSTVSVLSCVITLPIVYNHVQSVQSFMQSEVEFCKTRSRDMWKEMVQIQVATGIPVPEAANKTKRQAYEAAEVGVGSPGVGAQSALPPGALPQGGSCKL